MPCYGSQNFRLNSPVAQLNRSPTKHPRSQVTQSLIVDCLPLLGRDPQVQGSSVHAQQGALLVPGGDKMDENRPRRRHTWALVFVALGFLIFCAVFFLTSRNQGGPLQVLLGMDFPRVPPNAASIEAALRASPRYRFELGFPHQQQFGPDALPMSVYVISVYNNAERRHSVER